MSDVAARLLAALEGHGYDFFTGVPCSLLAGILRLLEAEPRYGYVGAVREDAAIGLAAGAWLGGRQPVVFMQNSGLGACGNALASLSHLYRIPALLVVSWRGQDPADAPEHRLTGATTRELLGLLEVPFEVLARERLGDQAAALTAVLRETRRPAALLVPAGLLA